MIDSSAYTGHAASTDAKLVPESGVQMPSYRLGVEAGCVCSLMLLQVVATTTVSSRSGAHACSRSTALGIRFLSTRLPYSFRPTSSPYKWSRYPPQRD